MLSRNVLASFTLFAALGLFLMACNSQTSSPLSPSGASLGVLNLEGGEGSCSDGSDNDDDKQIDCADSECAEDPACKTPPPPGGTPCSPGWWKQAGHQDEFATACAEVQSETGGDWTCAELAFAINCNGGPQTGCTGANRQAAAALLNATSIFPAGGCTE